MIRKNNLARCAAAIISVVMLVCILTGCSLGVFSGVEIDNPKKTVLEFINAMQTETFDQAAAQTATGYIANYSTMGFDKFAQVQDDDMEKRLFDMLRKSYRAEFSDISLEPVSSPYQSADITVSGKKAVVKFTFVSVDYTLMSAALSEAVTEAGSERMFHGETFETEAEAMALAQEVFDTVFAADRDMSEFCVERELALEMEYIDSKWKIVVSDEFYDALLGK